MASNENMQPYFHYTSRKHLDAIMASGYIKESDPEINKTDAVYGKGVYLTRQGPRNKNKKDIAENNWDAGWEQALRDNKLDYFICVLLPDKEVTKVTEGDIRDIYLYKGDLYYKNYKYEIMGWQTKEHVDGVDLGLVVFGLVVGVATLVGSVLHRIFS